MAETVNYLGVRFDRMTPEEAVDQLLDGAIARESRRVCFANAHTMNLCYKQPALRKALLNCDMLLADGSGVLWGSKLCGRKLTYNLNGTDLVPALCRRGAAAGLSVYLLGAKPGVATDVAKNLKAACPGVKIAGERDGYFKDDEVDGILADIRKSGAQVLLVAMGVPNQELWIDRYADRLPGVTCIGVGGLFDFLAERVPRAPRLFRAIGMEWLWRMMMEPRRLWKRYLIGNIVYLGHMLRHGWEDHPTDPRPNRAPKLTGPVSATSHSEFKHAGSEGSAMARSGETASRRKSA